jgi:hypothetical protein
MQKISIQQELDFKVILDAAAKLKLSELETIVREFNTLLELKKSKSKTKRIAILNQLIEQSALNNEDLKRYNELVYKLESRTMSDAEKEEFATLTEKDEILQNQRISYMIELAQLKAVPFSVIQEQFSFKSTLNV